jgi:regulator of sigma E protease
MSAVHYIFFFLLAIGVLIVFHEFGHYSAARLCGVRVLCFSMGFGPRIYSKRFGVDGTEWSLAAIPLGGYVKMLDEREGPVESAERHRAFNTQSVWKRAIIVAAGPVFNLVLAAVLYFGLACAGARDLPATLGSIPQNSSAALAGLHAGDRVVRFDGVEIRGMNELRWQIVQHAIQNQTVLLDVMRDGVVLKNLPLRVSGLSIDEKGPDPSHQLGLEPPAINFKAVIGELLPNKPAALAGFHKGDEVVSVDGEAVAMWSEFVKRIARAPGQLLRVKVLRDGALTELTVTPESVPAAAPGLIPRLMVWFKGADSTHASPDVLTTGRIGAGVYFDAAVLERDMTVVRYGILDGSVHAIRQTVEMASFDLRAFWQIIVGSLSWKNVSGPISIADAAGQSAKAGLDAYLSMIAALSVSLGVLNLLPIPVLDGGHLMYYVSECIRGRAVSERVEELGQKFGMVILALLMSLAFFNDLNRVLFG